MSRRPVRNILFITWDGPQTRYLERLFLPIFAGLGALGYRFHVVQFTWADAATCAARAAACAAVGIPYRSVPVWRRFGGAGAFLTAVFGAGAIRRAVADWQIDTLMPRSLMPALAVLRVRRSDLRALSIVFDADGLAADERVEFGGLSPHGVTYRLLRDVEAQMLRRSDVVLTRTAAAQGILLARAGAALSPERCFVVSNGVDVAPFAAALDTGQARAAADFVLCYCGSIGGQYRLPEMFDIAVRLKARIPALRFRLFSPDVTAVAAAQAARGLGDADWIEARAVPAEAVPQALVGCDLGLALRERSFSTQGILPIKLGEYLLAGVPVIGTPGVGMTAALESDGVFRSAEVADWAETERWVLETVLAQRDEVRLRSHEAGRRYFSVDATVAQYTAALKAANLPRSGGLWEDLAE